MPGMQVPKLRVTHSKPGWVGLGDRKTGVYHALRRVDNALRATDKALGGVRIDHPPKGNLQAPGLYSEPQIHSLKSR